MSFEQRFWSKVDKSGDCWLWKGSRFWSGYGAFELNGKVQRAHRVAWELTFGSIPDELQVLHYCDNPPCVNPEHLWLGTKADNSADMAKKDRVAYGEAQGSSKLKATEVVRIRKLAGSMAQRPLARLFGVNQSQVCRIIQREQWARL